MAAKRILIVGAGHVGLYAALRLSKKLNLHEAEVTVVDPQPHMTYQPFLPESAAGNISPRHAVVPLRRELERCHVLSGTVTSIEHARKVAIVQPIIGPAREVAYDHIVVAPGSVSRTLPIPGLREQAVGFKTIGEAVFLRNSVLDRLDVAATTDDEATRRRALAFVFVGGGYAGVEALAEMEDMVRGALRYYPEIPRDEVRFVLVEAANRILPEVGPEMGAYTAVELTRRGIDIRLGTRLESCVDGLVKLSDGDAFEADTIVWTAGVKPHPMLEQTDLPRTPRGAVTCKPTLQVVDADGNVVEGAWSAGDCAAVPDLTSSDPAALCSPSAQHAVRQASRLADNIAAVVRGREPVDYRHKHVGSVAGLGLYKGAARVYGIKVRGLPAWFMHRTYHLSRIPTLNRKIRVLVDWTLQLVLRREVVALGSLHEPREAFVEVAQPIPLFDSKRKAA
ncbi:MULTISPECIES: NAD(P)/FAD-dependent oxidoreductase [Dactylosporangium]|uniref:NADH dehydrogenase n=2 Tax=Dactylosporangium TaxID=35753 RepID=A0A9W6KCM5_9ACTN|nr:MULTISPECIES: NAD(P)/FAD-dependent oxidoreductase [Dactylosporangium]UAB95852.1 NAD(P)/FAD-dependent oxidoreductase [Dactylosporangium vinaceum]UWZ44219.1 NAD(P)/FAD-dependent oxidoreductase [Dactylosporangium matsuzakiense]GLK99640.1 NADH dehydrogenase [Dactylosporangium matsuzakiense]